MQTKSKLLDQVRTVVRLKHMSFRTEEAYVSWIRRFILLPDECHPIEMGAPMGYWGLVARSCFRSAMAVSGLVPGG